MDKTADASGIWRETSDASGRGEGHPPMTQSLKERLLEVESSSSRGGPLDIGSVTTNWYRNPDGPEAVREIERLEIVAMGAERRATSAEARVAELELFRDFALRHTLPARAKELTHEEVFSMLIHHPAVKSQEQNDV